MKQAKGLLADICDNPDEDGPRLVYADWLEDHGDPDRAEFIRAQIQLARLPPADPARRGLAAREKALLVAHGEAWRKEMPPWARAGSSFVRGLVGGVHAQAPAFLKGADLLFRRAPVQAVTL